MITRERNYVERVSFPFHNMIQWFIYVEYIVVEIEHLYFPFGTPVQPSTRNQLFRSSNNFAEADTYRSRWKGTLWVDGLLVFLIVDTINGHEIASESLVNVL